MQGMRWAGQHFPPSSCIGAKESQRKGTTEVPTLRRKQQFGQRLGLQGSSPPPWHQVAVTLKVTSRTLSYQVWAKPRCPTATQHQAASALGLTPLPAVQKLWAVRFGAQGPSEARGLAPLEHVDLVALHCVQVVI